MKTKVAATPKYFSVNLALLALIVGTVLSDILGRWLAVPLARGLAFFLAVMSLAPFARKHQIEFPRLLKLAVLAAAMALVWSLILFALGLK
jgi:uncharacterized membrane protein YiaA